MESFTADAIAELLLCFDDEDVEAGARRYEPERRTCDATSDDDEIVLHTQDGARRPSGSP